ncbi:MAG: TonB-dependent receptor [Tannerellaceae bacterium]|jgi:TonB-linked SusC/RagA family outer membrane protein|nr:TonB-dependent receptor [Tannerellaceae bacterium]
MKLTLVILFIGISGVFASNADSQTARVNINITNVQAKEIISQIEEQTDYLFVYNHLIDLSKKMSVQASNTPVAEVLARMFENTDIIYAMEGNNILLMKRNEFFEQQQNTRRITGTVVDEYGESIIGANIVEKGTTNGVVADGFGNFSIMISNNISLQVSYIGYITQEIAVKNQTTLHIILKEDTKTLDEVIVIGYGSIRKSDLTGAVSSVRSDALRDLPSNNISSALQGRVPGVHIQQNSGAPGANMQIRIRGANSITGSNEPLWIIDGFPGDQNTINTSDIESIEVLKDASSTAIYGSRGANGVIIVTTKQGKSGRIGVDYEGSFSIQKVRKKLDLMNGNEYARFYNTFWKTTQGEDYFTQQEMEAFGKGIDWQGLIFRSAPIHDHALNITGGNEKTKFSVGTSIFDQKGIIKENSFQRIVLRANINHEISKKLVVSYNSILSRTNHRPTDDTNILLSALSATPTVGPYTDDGKYRQLNDVYSFSPDNLINPIAYFNETSNKQISNKVMANLAFIYKPIDDLSIKISGNVTNTDYRSDNYTGVEYPNSSGRAGISTNNSLHLNSDNIITYNKRIDDKHNITATGAFTYEDYTYKSLNASGSGFLSDATESYNLGSASTINTPSSSYSNWTLLSYLGRINYSFNNKYLATVSLRTDGSSRYSEGNKWGYFPSGAIAWRVSEENFMKNILFISDAKIRIGYGETGSTAIDPYYTLDMLSSGKVSFNDALYTYYAPETRLPSDLKWETTSQTDIGLDLHLFNNRIRITADYYIKNTRDLLNTVQLPASLGYTTTVKNIGKVRNKGFEFFVDANIINDEFKWDASASISFNKNKVIKLYDNQDIQGTTYNISIANDYVNILREGKSMSAFYGYLSDGFDGEGHFKYKDLDSDGSISDKDKDFIGDPNPDYLYGFTSNFSWKNFDLSFFIQGSQGNDIYSLSMITQNHKVYLGYNMLKEVFYDHWTPQNTNAKYPAIDNTISTKISDHFIYDGSYVRLKNIKLAYNLPVNKIGINWLQKGQIYISGQNLLTITKYPWWDPDVNTKGGSNSINQGIDDYSYPTTKSFTVGLKLSF